MLSDKNYETIPGSDCVLSCINNYMNYVLGRSIEKEIFLLGNGFTHDYDRRQGLLCTGLARSSFRFMDRMGVKYVKKYARSARQARKKLHALIENEELVSINVWSRDMSYNKVFMRSLGAPHYINIIGVDEKDFIVSDGYCMSDQGEVYQCRVPQKKVLRSWEMMDYRYVVVDKESALCLQDFTLDEGQYLEEIRGLMSGFLKCDESMRGHNGYLCVSEYLSDLQKALWKSKNLYGDVEKAFYFIKIYGFIKSRQMLSGILNMQNPAYPDISAAYEKIVKEWDHHWIFLMKYSMQGKRENVIGLLKEMEELCREEMAVFEEWLDQAGHR